MECGTAIEGQRMERPGSTSNRGEGSQPNWVRQQGTSSAPSLAGPLSELLLIGGGTALGRRPPNRQISSFLHQYPSDGNAEPPVLQVARV